MNRCVLFKILCIGMEKWAPPWGWEMAVYVYKEWEGGPICVSGSGRNLRQGKRMTTGPRLARFFHSKGIFKFNLSKKDVLFNFIIIFVLILWYCKQRNKLTLLFTCFPLNINVLKIAKQSVDHWHFGIPTHQTDKKQKPLVSWKYPCGEGKERGKALLLQYYCE